MNPSFIKLLIAFSEKLCGVTFYNYWKSQQRKLWEIGRASIYKFYQCSLLLVSPLINLEHCPLRILRQLWEYHSLGNFPGVNSRL